MRRILRFGWLVVMLLAATGCSAPKEETPPVVSIETSSYVNLGLDELFRLDLHSEPATNRVFGTFSVVRGYSDLESDRFAQGFSGVREGNSLHVNFAGEAPYAVAPGQEENASVTWHRAIRDDGMEVIEIETYGRNYNNNRLEPYVMQLERIQQ